MKSNWTYIRMKRMGIDFTADPNQSWDDDWC